MRVIDNVGFDVKKQDIPGGGSGNGGGRPLATPDLAQNDETAPDYVKNRAFYTTDPVEKELVNGTFAFALDSVFNLHMTDGVTIDLIEGETYKVTLDGVEYETVCQSYNGMAYIGELNLLLGGVINYPFLYGPGAEGVPFATNIEGDSHEIIIATTQGEVVQIPDKYIPDTFNNIVVASDPKGWSEADWAKYYDLFQRCKLLKLAEESGYNRESVGFILSMSYKNSNKRATYIDQHGQIFTFDQNSTTGKGYWAPIFYLNELYFSYGRSGSSLSGNDQAAYNKLGASSSGLTFITKKTDEDAVERKVVLEGDKSLILSSSTANSTKKFAITVDDTGTLTATEVTG